MALRKRLALPVLRQLRDAVSRGENLSLALFHFEGALLDREYAKWALRRSLFPGLDYASLLQFGDAVLWLWLIDKAVKFCTPVHAVSRGGWRVTRRSA